MITRSIPLLLFIFMFHACADPRYVAASEMAAKKQDHGRCQANFASGGCVDYFWEIIPTEREFGSFVFKTFRPDQTDGSPILEDMPGEMKVRLWMPSMGHGSSPVKVDRLAVGTYRATNVFFSMRGQWEIRFQLMEGNDVQDEAIIPFDM